MMERALTNEVLSDIVARIMDNAIKAKNNAVAPKGSDAFDDGRAMAYYEVLSIMQSILEVDGYDLSSFGLDVDLDNMLL